MKYFICFFVTFIFFHGNLTSQIFKPDEGRFIIPAHSFGLSNIENGPESGNSKFLRGGFLSVKCKKDNEYLSNGFIISGEIHWGDYSGLMADIRYLVSLFDFKKKYIPNPFIEGGFGIGEFGKDNWKFTVYPVISAGALINLPGQWYVGYQLNYKHNFNLSYKNIIQNNIMIGFYYSDIQAGNLDFPEYKGWTLGSSFMIWSIAILGTLITLIF